MINKILFSLVTMFCCIVLATNYAKNTIYLKATDFDATIELSSNIATFFWSTAGWGPCDGNYTLDKDNKIFQVIFERPRWGCFEKSFTARFEPDAMEDFFQGKSAQALITIEGYYADDSKFLATMQMK